MIKIVNDRDLILDIFDYNLILIGTSTKNSLGNGFQHKIAKSFPFVKEANNKTKYDDSGKLGTVQVVVNSSCPSLVFALCYITKGRFRPDLNPDTLDYEALGRCLDAVARNFPGEKIASTILGNSKFEGGGDKKRILEIFKDKMKDIDITLYDYEQVDYRKEENEIYWGIVNDWKDGKIDRQEYVRRMDVYKNERKYGLYGKESGAN